VKDVGGSLHFLYVGGPLRDLEVEPKRSVSERAGGAGEARVQRAGGATDEAERDVVQSEPFSPVAALPPPPSAPLHFPPSCSP